MNFTIWRNQLMKIHLIVYNIPASQDHSTTVLHDHKSYLGNHSVQYQPYQDFEQIQNLIDWKDLVTLLKVLNVLCCSLIPNNNY